MVQLVPVPFGVLVSRLFRELEQKRSAFDLPSQRFVQGSPGHDLSVAIHGRRASTPFGPAAGPHTQMAQNIVLSWLAGGRGRRGRMGSHLWPVLTFGGLLSLILVQRPLPNKKYT